MNLAEILSSPIDGRYKGIPAHAPALRLDQLGQQGWNILREDVLLPVAVIKSSAVAHNSAWMKRFLALSGASFAPHGKTTMAPQLFAQQLADGAWGLTLATLAQIQIARRFGVPRILMANQLVGKPAIAFIAAEMQADPQFEFFTLVDSVAQVQALAQQLQAAGAVRPLAVLVEGGFIGGRTGCRTLAEALEVAQAVKATEGALELVGVEGFEGLLSGENPQLKQAKVQAFLKYLVEIAQACEAQQLFARPTIILSAGGSEFFDLVADILPAAGLQAPVQVVIRSGCYLTHDSDLFVDLHQQLQDRTPAAAQLGQPPYAALELWSYVQSRPEPTFAVLMLGKRDASFDVRLPLPVWWFRPGLHTSPQAIPAGHKILRLNDQHAILDIPATSPLAYGDLVGCGISHACTTFDKWQLLLEVDDQYNVTGGIRTFF